MSKPPPHLPPTPPELIAIIEEIRGQSDRGAAILVGGILSEFLGRAILKKFIPTSNRRRAKLFEGFGPLSSFSARIEIAYSLGLLDDPDYNDITVIKDIRNEFAHSIEPMSFQSEPILALIGKLKYVVGPTDEDTDTPRKKFMMSVLECMLDLTHSPVPLYS